MNRQDTKVNPEDTLVNARDTRVNAEETSVNRKDTKVRAEETLVNREDTKVNAENTKVQAKTTKVNARDTWVNAQATEVDAEETKVNPKDSQVSVQEPQKTPVHFSKGRPRCSTSSPGVQDLGNPRWHPDNHGPGRNILGDHRPGTDDGPKTDRQALIRLANNDRADANGHPVFNDDAIRRPDRVLGRDGDVVIDRHVVTDGDIGMDHHTQPVVFEPEALACFRLRWQYRTKSQKANEFPGARKWLEMQCVQHATELPHLRHNLGFKTHGRQDANASKPRVSAGNGQRVAMTVECPIPIAAQKSMA